MNERSNLGSIIVTVIAICLILGGVFLLNQSFIKKPQENNLETVFTSSSSVLQTESSSSSRSSSESSSSESSSESESSRSSRSNSSQSSNESSSSSRSSARSGSSSSGSRKYDLKENTFVAKAIEPTSKGSNWEIVECNVKTVYWCKPGFKFPFSHTGDIGKNYLFAGGDIEDTADSLNVSKVNPKAVD